VKAVVHAIILVLAAGGPLQTADAPQFAIVSGRVVDAVTGRPIAGAVVTTAGSAAADATLPVLTNAGGHFVVRPLHKGSVALMASKGGYVDGTFGQRRPGGSRQLITIDDGERVVDLEIRLWRHAVITGTVIDEAGEPVIGTRVRAFQRILVATRYRFGPAGDAFTDDRGAYRIPNLMPGSYIVAVPSIQTSIPTEVMDAFFVRQGSDAQRAELAEEMRRIDAAIVPAGTDYAMAAGTVTMLLSPGTATPTSRPGDAMVVYPTAFHPAAPVAAQAGIVTLGSGEERANIDIQLQPSRGARVSGILTAPPGMASYVGLRLVPLGSEALGEQIETATAMTDSAGAFTFVAVPPGQYVLSVVRIPRTPPDPDDGSKLMLESGSVRVAARPPPGRPAAPPPVPADATLWAQVPLAVGTADISDIVVPLRPGPRMTGTVQFDGAAAPPPLATLTSLRVSLDPADGSPGAKGLALDVGHPDERGQFTTYGVPPGRYVVNVGGGVPGWVFRGVQYQGRDVTDRPIEMSTADIAGVVLIFTDRPSTLSGTLRTRGQPDPAAVALAFPVEEEMWSSSGASPRRMRIARADAAGAYSFPNLPGGDYYIAAVSDESMFDLNDPALLRALSRVARQIQLVDREQARQDLETVAIR